MTTYAVLGANNQIQDVPIQTWGDSCYVLFGKAQRDLIDTVDHAIATVARPAFDLKKNQPLEPAGSVAEAAYARETLLAPDRLVARNLYVSILAGKAQYDYQWDEWSQLLDPQFLFQVLAYAIHSVALKVWDLIDGIDQKAVNITNWWTESCQMVEAPLEIEIVKDKLFSSASVALFQYDTDADFYRGMKITFADDNQTSLHVEVQRLYPNSQDANLSPEVNLYVLPTFSDPALEITFDLNDQSDKAQEFQCAVALDLMRNEQATSIFIRTRALTDLSAYGFQKIENFKNNEGHIEFDDFQFWRMENPNKDSDVQRRNILPQLNLFPPDKMAFAQELLEAASGDPDLFALSSEEPQTV